jgi:uncharacterized protein YndB with AHSA1/START domain
MRALTLAFLLACAGTAATAQVTGTNANFRMTAGTSASKSAVYALWADPKAWPRWDSQVATVTFTGPAKVGAKGKIKGKGGPESAFEITAMVPNERFSYVVRSAGAQITYDQSFEAGEATKFTHSVKFSGAAGGFLSGILGKRFRAALPDSMAKLKSLAEASKN